MIAPTAKMSAVHQNAVPPIAPRRSAVPAICGSSQRPQFAASGQLTSSEFRALLQDRKL